MNNTGILVFVAGKPTERDALYDSRKGRITVNLGASPPHLAVIDDVPGGTAFTVTPGSSQEETLLTIPHGLPFTPECFVYFYAKSYGGSTTHPAAGKYAGGMIIYSGAAPNQNDAIYMEVDSKNLYIKHKTQVDILAGAPYTSDASSYLLRLKYYITSNDSHVASYGPGETLR